MKILIAVSTLALLWAPAEAESQVSTTSIQVDTEPTAVKIRIDNLEVSHNSLSTRGDRIYIDLADTMAGQELRLDDKTVKLVQIISGDRPRISVQLRHGRQKTREIGAAATVENIDGGVVLHVPRWPIIVEEPAVEAVIEEVPVAVETASVAAPEASAPSEPLADPKPAAEAQAPPTATGDEPASITGTGKSSEGSSMGLIVGIVLLLAGGGIFAWRARKKSGGLLPEAEELRVVASKHLGGKSKVVWLSVGDREMVVAVADGGTHLLSEWNRADAPAAAPAKQIAPTLLDLEGVAEVNARTESQDSTLCDFKASLEKARRRAPRATPTAKKGPSFAKGLYSPMSIAPEPAPQGTMSPAVAGLVRLREQVPAVSAEVATYDEEADAEWARELLRATKDGMSRRAG